MKRTVIGMTAHVDAGKTTLSEAMLYVSGEIRSAGRVDKGNSFLDTHSIERSRGITVFSKQAVMHMNGGEYTLLDTPGHADLSAETERAFGILDYAILVISASDGVQSHTETVWRLLSRYRIPVFIFVNKTDISENSREYLMAQLRSRLSDSVADFSPLRNREEFFEEAAALDEDMMNAYLDSGNISDELLRKAISKRHIFPCYFGSALKMKGIEELLRGLEKYTEEKKYPQEFGAKVYKITSENGTRLTHMKITGGSLPVKTSVGNEKINQIRIYSGVKYSAPEEVSAGTVCAVTGLNSSFAGMGLGFEDNGSAPVLEPVLSYRVIFPAQVDDSVMLENLRKLEEEDPQLHVAVNSRTKEINVRLMGEIQLEILRSLVMERFGIPIDFDRGSITYKETINAPTEGIGHYEPLRHYAEVHLLMEPGEPGSGICFASAVSEDDLDRNWQRLILSNLESEPHYGVLTGAPITDIKITLAAGKAHLKHTEGGDFRQAARRAVRMGLMSTESQLLEPWYRFTLEVPSECTGRAMTDLQRMNAKFSSPEMCGEMTVITGTAPAALMMHYHTDAAGYSHGKARLNCTVCGYFPCHNAEEIIAAANYDPEADTENPPDSVFCSHGAGVTVKWYDVRSHMHVDSGIRFGEKRETSFTSAAPVHAPKEYNDEELMEIFERTYGKINRDDDKKMRRDREQNIPKHKPKPVPKGPEYLLADGYNIIFAWDELKKLAADNLDAARSRLTDILCNYRAYRRCELILVFDAYRVKGDVRETENVNGISVIYTKEAETADMFIEKTAHDLSGEHRVRVATSDGAEQIIIMGNGAFRVSANELYDEVKAAEKAVADIISRMPKGSPTKNIINGVQK